MKPTSAATYERARRLANLSLWTISLQYRRLNSIEPEDDKFILRKWSDFLFFIVALTRLRRAANLAAKIPEISPQMRKAIKTFDVAFPNLKTMRDVAEHIDDYACDCGHDASISRYSLEVSSFDGDDWKWLGFEINIKNALDSSVCLFKELKYCSSIIKKLK
jgi:hypothetical protein